MALAAGRNLTIRFQPSHFAVSADISVAFIVAFLKFFNRKTKWQWIFNSLQKFCPFFAGFFAIIYLTIIPRGRVGYEMIEPTRRVAPSWL